MGLPDERNHIQELVLVAGASTMKEVDDGVAAISALMIPRGEQDVKSDGGIVDFALVAGVPNAEGFKFPGEGVVPFEGIEVLLVLLILGKGNGGEEDEDKKRFHGKGFWRWRRIGLIQLSMILKSLFLVVSLLPALFSPVAADELPVDVLDGKRVAFLGDSITQGGAYVGFTAYYLNRLHPEKSFDIFSLGLSSETLSGLSEEGHAGGRFPRPCLFERYGRLLEKVKPEVVFACYGINCGIYLPLNEERFSAFKEGVARLIKDGKAAGVKQFYLVTPPIYDTKTKEGEFNYDSVMAAYAAWQMTLKVGGVTVIDLHSAMRAARDARDEVFSKDRVHPGKEGHLFMATTILKGLKVELPGEELSDLSTDPLLKLVEQQRSYRSKQWMRHIGYHREKLVEPQPLGDTEAKVAEMQVKIDSLRRK